MSSFIVENIDLKKLDFNDPLWEKIIGLTVEGWRARTEFKEIRHGFYPEAEFLLRLVFIDERPIAWGFRGDYKNEEEPVLWLYTHPDYRKLGIQSRLILPYFNELGDRYAVWMELPEQKRVFSKLKKKVDVSGDIPVDLSV